MCSHYPRTEIRHINSMKLYHQCRESATNHAALLEKYYARIAATVVEALDKAAAAPSWLKAEDLSAQYERTILSVGGTVAQLLTPEIRQEMIRRKIASGLFD
jgi:hypothetical protein